MLLRRDLSSVLCGVHEHLEEMLVALDKVMIGATQMPHLMR